jgi:Domain of unknown function (DUF1707)
VVRVNENAREPARAARSVIAPDLRVSDAERDAVVTELSEHLQAGRLDQEEFGERMAKALSSRTGRDLAALLKDLPPLRETVNRPAWPGRPPFFPLAVIPLVIGAFAIAGAVGGFDGPHHPEGGPWLLFPLFWLAAIVVFRFGWWRRRSPAR